MCAFQRPTARRSSCLSTGLKTALRHVKWMPNNTTDLLLQRHGPIFPLEAVCAVDLFYPVASNGCDDLLQLSLKYIHQTALDTFRSALAG